MSEKKQGKQKAKTRELLAQLQVAQARQARQLADILTTLGKSENRTSPDDSRQAAKTRAELAALKDENARQATLLSNVRRRVERWRGKSQALMKEVETRLSQAAARERKLQEQYARLLGELGGTAAYAVENPLKERGGVERRLAELRGGLPSIIRKPLSVTDLVSLGDRANAKRDWKLAVDCYALALQRDPSLVAIWVQYGHALKESGLMGLAEAAYHRATVLDPEATDPQLQLGHFLLRLGRVDAAQAAFAKAAAADATAAELAAQTAQWATSSAEDACNELKLALGKLAKEVADAVAAPEVAPGAAADDEPGPSLQSVGASPTRSPRTLTERYGKHLPEAMATLAGQDIIWLGVIDWAFRIQRPQQLALQLAAQGRRVFYISIQFEAADSAGRFRILTSPSPNVFEVRLRLEGAIPANIYGGFDPLQVDDIRAALDELIAVVSIRSPAVVVQYPAWYPIAMGVPGGMVVHDCLDFVGGFDNVPPEMVELEKLLVRDADLVVTSSAPLAEHVGRKNVLVRNGAEVQFFAQAARQEERPAGRAPVIGYFGAIAEWYEIDWVLDCARARPEWQFQLIGEVTGFDRATKAIPDNVVFTGEMPYAELPSRLREFDVAIIPFKLTDLIRCTNPVKLYEYMAAGKPVVASAMPEVVAATDLVYIAADSADFERQIDRALKEDSFELRRRRMEWASHHSWTERAKAFADALAATTPKVSVVILAYNNWSFTATCLNSVLGLSDYPNLEVIVVDNASTDETRERLATLRDPRLRIVLNDQNLGFAGGNNAGMRAATGEYVVILNNDTYVTKGWVRDLIRPMIIDPSVGLVGPVTNNIGNEQKLSIHYANMYEMAETSRARVRRQLRSRYEAALAFFCVALSQETLRRVGYLDEAYGVGFFEDDDYCRRVEEAGMRMVIADDVFIHHHLSASFDAMGSEAKRRQMETNKAIYEKRWGPWKPHRYRAAEGYGP